MARSGTETRKKSLVITARFNQQEADALRQMAEKSGLSVGSLIRSAVFNTEPPRAVRRPSVNDAAVARILGQLGKIGSNVNQLAHHAHLGRYREDSIEMALRDLSELRHACLHALGYEPEHDHTDQSDTEEI